MEGLPVQASVVLRRVHDRTGRREETKDVERNRTQTARNPSCGAGESPAVSRLRARTKHVLRAKDHSVRQKGRQKTPQDGRE